MRDRKRKLREITVCEECSDLSPCSLREPQVDLGNTGIDREEDHGYALPKPVARARLFLKLSAMGGARAGFEKMPAGIAGNKKDAAADAPAIALNPERLRAHRAREWRAP